MRAGRLEFSGAARRDLREIGAYLTKVAGSRVAARMAARIKAAIAATRELPRMGTPRPNYRPNCRFIFEPPYFMYYDYDGTVMSSASCTGRRIATRS